jgi:hypothetical protein
MKYATALPLAALLLACNALAGIYATVAVSAVVEAGRVVPLEQPQAAPQDYPGKPAPVLLSPFARAIAAPQSEGLALGPLSAPDTETDEARSVRRAAEATAAIAGIFADPDCRPNNPVPLVSCRENTPEARRR